MIENKQYPISEMFLSQQGEGTFAGQMQFFIRFAGCTVGKPYSKDRYEERYSTDTAERPLHLPIYTECCTLYDKRQFPCDTDYRVKDRLTADQILSHIPDNVANVCITGGEPLMRDMSEVFNVLCDAGKKIHIETSGTIDQFLSKDVWVTVSPKFNCCVRMLHRADELKILVDKDFDINDPIQAVHSDGMVHALSLHELAKQKPVFLQPINRENEVDSDNLRLCMDLQIKYPNFRLSPQLHKVLSVFIGELVR